MIVWLPWDGASSFLRGAAAAPTKIREALRSAAGNPFSESGVDVSEVLDHGDIESPNTSADALTAGERQIGSMLAAGLRPMALGGDHSVTNPILRAVSAHLEGVTVVHLDAHADLYDDFDGDRFSHACPFARVMEERLVGRLVQVGIRTLTPHQRDQAARFHVDCIEMRRFASGVRPSVAGPIYLSVDLDVLDPAFAPGVSHREPGGLTVRELVELIQALPCPIIGADVVEYNPQLDLGGVTAQAAAKIVKQTLARMIEVG